MAGEFGRSLFPLKMNARRRLRLRLAFLFVLVGGIFLSFFSGGTPVRVFADGEKNTPISPTVKFTETVTETPTETPSPTLTPTPTETPKPDLELPTLNGDFVEDEVIVRFAPAAGNAQEASAACFANGQVEITRELGAVGASLLKIKDGSVAEIMALAENCPQVIFAEPNYKLYALDTFPNDPNWSLQYGLTAIRAPQGWDVSIGSPAVVIAIIDTGVDLTHPDLAPKMVAGFDFVNNDNIAQDDNGHGSHVAGIAAASSNNGVGVSGVSWGAKIMPIKVLSASASGTFANAAEGIVWAANNGAHIINLSLGGSSYSKVFEDAINYAYDKGVMIIASSGNNGGAILYPARFANVMAVGATDQSNVLAYFSNYGAELDVVAPGVSIYSTGINSYYHNSGTSMAAPFVSGLASILRGFPGSGSPANLAWAIKSTALDLGVPGRDIYYGDGLIQMDAAIQLLWIPPTATPTNTQTATPTNALTVTPTTTSVSGNSDQTGIWLAPLTPTMSLTTTPTVTVSPTFVMTISPATVSPSITPYQGEAELFGLSTPTQSSITAPDTGNAESYLPLCCGSSLIIIGVLLAMFSRKIRDLGSRQD